jgi:5-methylcytosine-specific restriction endonuclease McrA
MTLYEGGGRCVECGGPLTGQQTKYCSRRCINCAWYYRNHEEQLQYHRESYARRRDRLRELHRAWYLANRERALANARAWLKANPERRANYARARRAVQSGVAAHVTREEWEHLLLAYAYSCGYCGDWTQPLTADHRVPLSRGGSHSIDNLIPACRACNSRKGSLTELEFLARLRAENDGPLLSAPDTMA